MICKIRGMAVKEIQEEIKSMLNIDMSMSSLYNKIQRYDEMYAKQFQELKKSNHDYLSKLMEIINRYSYYRQILTNLVYQSNTNQLVSNPSQIYKNIEMLLRLDRSEFDILKEIPDIFAWKNSKNSLEITYIVQIQFITMRLLWKNMLYL